MMMRKREKTCLDHATVNVWRREIGELSTRNFARRAAASEYRELLLRLDVARNLDMDDFESASTLRFNAAGDILLSATEEGEIILWDWEIGQIKHSFHSGHELWNISDTKFVPYTEDRSIITCAGDGQVRLAQISESGEVKTKLLAKHQGEAHKLAVEPGNPDICYTCGEDGLVHHVDLITGTATGLFKCKPVQEHHLSAIKLNAIAIDPRNPNSFAVGGSDQFARLFDIRRYKCDGSSIYGKPVDFFCPPHLVEDKQVTIAGLEFSNQSEFVVSYYHELIYLFTRDIGLGPDAMPDNCSSPSLSKIIDSTKATPQAYRRHWDVQAVNYVNFLGPSCEYIVSVSGRNRISIWRKKDGVLIQDIASDKHVVCCIDSHPQGPTLASSGVGNDIEVWMPQPRGWRRVIPPTNTEMWRILESLGVHLNWENKMDELHTDSDDGNDSENC